MGAWWLTVAKLDSEVAVLRRQLEVLEAYPSLRACAAMQRAHAGVARAEGALRRVAPPSGWGWEGADRPLVAAAQAVAEAAEAVRGAVQLALHARQARPQPAAAIHP